MTDREARLADWVQAACAMEVMSPKPGNVSPGKPFSDLSVSDFLGSAAAIAPVLATAVERSVGATVLHCIEATRRRVQSNTNLGIVLLLAPLCAVPPEQTLRHGIEQVLEQLTIDDSIHVYRAIRLAAPGGIGEAAEQDLNSEPTLDLRRCMQLAAAWDQIAAQYANGFQQVLWQGQEWLAESRQQTKLQPLQITLVAIRLLAEYGDSLIARKCGSEVSASVRQLAQGVLREGWPETQRGRIQFDQLDQYLRADGHRRNPGTTADLIAAILFAGLREGWVSPDGDWWIRTES